MSISAISQLPEAKKNCRHKSQNRFKVANVVKLLALNVNVFSTISFLQRTPNVYE
jgi:hypothetical protein